MFTQPLLRIKALLTVLLATTVGVVAVGGWYWWNRRFHARDLCQEYKRAVERQHADLANVHDVCAASAALRDAQEAIPFSSPVLPQALHCIRLWKVEEERHATILNTLYATERARRQARQEVKEVAELRRKEVKELDTLLGTRGLCPTE